MPTDDLTPEILKSIRKDITDLRTDFKGEIRELRAELKGESGQLRGGLAEANVRLDRLHQRQVETEVRLATELVNVVSAIHEVRDELRADRELRSRVEDHERRIGRLEARD
jgi:hypothetical protein